MNLTDIISAINARFISGNSIPVERAPIKADEWAVIRAALAKATGETK